MYENCKWTRRTSCIGDVKSTLGRYYANLVKAGC